MDKKQFKETLLEILKEDKEIKASIDLIVFNANQKASCKAFNRTALTFDSAPTVANTHLDLVEKE
jgi:hypothetical protein